MSYTTIKALWPGEKHEDYRELRNSWGSAPVIWDALTKRWLPGKQWLSCAGGSDNSLWNLCDDQRLPLHQRAVLMMTFDRAYVAKANYSRAAQDIRAFLRDLPPPAQNVNHWPEIATLFESDPDIPALGFHHTSVSEDPFQGPYNEEADDYDAPDWSKCYEIYAELEARDGA